MKRPQLFIFVALIGWCLEGCSSSDTPQASAQLKNQFAGGPMPPDAQKKFQESMRKNKDLMQQRSQDGGKP